MQGNEIISPYAFCEIESKLAKNVQYPIYYFKLFYGFYSLSQQQQTSSVDFCKEQKSLCVTKSNIDASSESITKFDSSSDQTKKYEGYERENN